MMARALLPVKLQFKKEALDWTGDQSGNDKTADKSNWFSGGNSALTFESLKLMRRCCCCSFDHFDPQETFNAGTLEGAVDIMESKISTLISEKLCAGVLTAAKK